MVRHGLLGALLGVMLMMGWGKVFAGGFGTINNGPKGAICAISVNATTVKPGQEIAISYSFTCPQQLAPAFKGVWNGKGCAGGWVTYGSSSIGLGNNWFEFSLKPGRSFTKTVKHKVPSNAKPGLVTLNAVSSISINVPAEQWKNYPLATVPGTQKTITLTVK